jgi:hypothetical protein
MLTEGKYELSEVKISYYASPRSLRILYHI